MRRLRAAGHSPSAARTNLSGGRRRPGGWLRCRHTLVDCRLPNHRVASPGGTSAALLLDELLEPGALHLLRCASLKQQSSAACAGAGCRSVSCLRALPKPKSLLCLSALC